MPCKFITISTSTTWLRQSVIIMSYQWRVIAITAGAMLKLDSSIRLIAALWVFIHLHTISTTSALQAYSHITIATSTTCLRQSAKIVFVFNTYSAVLVIELFNTGLFVKQIALLKGGLLRCRLIAFLNSRGSLRICTSLILYIFCIKPPHESIQLLVPRVMNSFLVVDTRSVGTTLAVGQNMQILSLTQM